MNPHVDRAPERREAESMRPVSVSQEAKDAAVRAAEAAMNQPGFPLAEAIVLGGMEMVRKLRELARRAARYPLAGGQKLEGVHVQDVSVALQVFHHYAGSEAGGPISEDAMARALAAAYASRERREERELAKCRKVARRDSDLVAGLEEVSQRVERHRAAVLLERATR